MSASRWIFRCFCVLLLCSFILTALQPGVAQDGGNPDPSEPFEATPLFEPGPAGPTPEGLTPQEWESIQAQIAAAQPGPALPSADAVSNRLPTYLVAPIARVFEETGIVSDNFGYSVDIDGEQMIVGARFADISTKTNQGAAYLFQRNRNNPDQWGLTKKIVASDGLANDHFGYAVTISGDIVAIGAPVAAVSSGGYGAVYIHYRNSGGLNNWGNVKKLTGGGADSSAFGQAVDLSNDKLIVGDPYWKLSGNSIGHAYIFYMNKDSVNWWGLVQTLANWNPVPYDLFGAAVAIEGDLCAVGSPGRDDNDQNESGAVYLYNRNLGGTDLWGQLEEISANQHSYMMAGDSFGKSLALDHGVLVVGAPYKETAGSTDGGVVFVLAPSYYPDEWLLQAILAPPQTSASDNARFGSAVDKHGQFIVVGADSWGGSNKTGAAFIYQQNRGSANDWGLVQQVTAVNGVSNDYFGNAVAISNDRIAIGAYNDMIGSNSGQGSVHVFALQAQDWYISRQLTDVSSIYGVAMHGDWLALGLASENDGEVHIFQRNQGSADGWGIYKELYLPDGLASDKFGYSVAMYGDLLAVGVPYRDGSGYTDNGLVVLYKRDQGGLNNWGEWQRYTMNQDDYRFGWSIAVHQDLLAIGAPYADSLEGIVWMCGLTASGCGSWKSILDNDGRGDAIGTVLSLDHDTLAVSNLVWDEVDLYYRNLNGADQWGRIKTLTGSSVEKFGGSLSLSGELLAVGSPNYDNGTNIDQGRVKIYSKNLGGADAWGEMITLLGSGGDDNHYYGMSVALYYDRLLVGAPGCSIDGDGCIYAYRRNHGGKDNWGSYDRILGPYGSDLGSHLAVDGYTAAVGGGGQASVLSLGANYYTFARTAAPREISDSGGLGYSVALYGDLLVAGAPDEASGYGAAYIFKRDQHAPNSWTLLRRIFAADGVLGDRFGASVSLSGNWLAVGAVKATTFEPGFVYLFERDTGGAEAWGQFKKLTCPDAANCAFGYKVALAGNTLAVGAPTRPAVFLYYKDQGGTNAWGLKKRLDSADWYFGWDLALDGDALIVGAPEADVDSVSDQGAAYIFSRNQGGTDNWGQVKKLTADDGTNCAADCAFGVSVAVHNEVAVAGAIYALTGKGAAYVFYRDLGGANAWGKLKRLSASDSAASDDFGWDVGVYGNHILVGARNNDIAANVDQGAVYWYWRTYNGADFWGQVSRILLPDGYANDEFGTALAVWDDLLIVGAPVDRSTFSNGIGAAHIFRLMLPREIFLPLLRR